MGSFIAWRSTAINQIALPWVFRPTVTQQKVCWETRRFVLQDDLSIFVGGRGSEIRAEGNSHQIRDIRIDIQPRLRLAAFQLVFRSQCRQAVYPSIRFECSAKLLVQGSPDVVDTHPARVNKMAGAIGFTFLTDNRGLQLLNRSASTTNTSLGKLSPESNLVTLNSLADRVSRGGSNALFREQVIMDEEKSKKRRELERNHLVSQQVSQRSPCDQSHLALKGKDACFVNNLCQYAVPFRGLGGQRIDLRRGCTQIASAVDSRLE